MIGDEASGKWCPETREEHQTGRRNHEDAGSEIVDGVVHAAQAPWDLDRHDRERDSADRDIDVEDPAPRELFDEDAPRSGPRTLATPKTAPKSP